MTSDRPWALAIRVLAIAVLLLAVVAVLEAVAIRKTRAELQQLREEREAAKGTLAESWARQSREEFAEAVRWLHAFAADSTDGLGHTGGLCPGGTPDADAIATWVLGVYAPARAEGRSKAAAIEAMQAAIVKKVR